MKNSFLILPLLWMGLAVPAAAQEQPAQPAQPPPPQPPDIRQVQIQVWISETGETGLREIGTNLNYTRFVRGAENRGTVERIRTDMFENDNVVTLPAPDLNGYPDNLRPDLDGNRATGVQTFGGAGLTFSIIDTGRGTIDGMVRGSEERRDVDLISKPEILVRNGQPATVHAGGEVPYQSIVGAEKKQNILDVKWRDVGVKMTIVPVIRPDGLIHLHFQNLEVTNVARIENVRGLDLPVFAQRSQTGQVLVPNGQSLVIGGLSSRIVRQTERRVPIIGDIPLFGFPFRSKTAESDSSNLLVFVSPTMVNLMDMEPAALSAMAFWREENYRFADEFDQELVNMEFDQ